MPKLLDMTMRDLTNAVLQELKNGITNGVWDGIQAASKRRQKCPRHLFDDLGVAQRGSRHWHCARCNNGFGPSEVTHYAEGFKAAGGDEAELFSKART